METPLMGTICYFAFGFAPEGWRLCDGAYLDMAQNSALYSLLGTKYGGNNSTKFALPSIPPIKTTDAVGAGPAVPHIEIYAYIAVHGIYPQRSW
jgi:microcystin-dependent protein